MCFQDWRIGRTIRSVPRLIPTDTNGFVLLPSSTDRVGLTIVGTPTGNGIFIAPNQTTVATATALILSNQLPLHFTLNTHGDLPILPWVLQSQAVAVDSIMLIEYFAPEWLLHQGLQELMKQYHHH